MFFPIAAIDAATVAATGAAIDGWTKRWIGAHLFASTGYGDSCEWPKIQFWPDRRAVEVCRTSGMPKI